MVLCMTESQAYSIAWTRHDVHRTILYRSEEHTSELQSHLNLVCRLLLEKKKNTNQLQSHLNLVWRLLSEKEKQVSCLRHDSVCNAAHGLRVKWFYAILSKLRQMPHCNSA